MKNLFLVMILFVGLLFTLPPVRQVAARPTDQSSSIVNNLQITPEAFVQKEGGGASNYLILEETAPAIGEQIEATEDQNFFLDNWGVLILGLLAFVDVVARLTPTEKDNSVVNFLLTLFNAIVPNLRKGGGRFRLLSK